ncbi:MAG: DUF2752 domain-containing protein [Muribaculaceae bacterium]|nr:DUF2752 domain-containing protein [Muribaculaceae bacterium]
MISSRRLLYILAIAAAVCGVAGILYLAFNDPETSPAPSCIFHRLTGYDCPGCGTQRAVHALLQGRVADAWKANAALFFAVPLAGLYIGARGRLRQRLESPLVIAAIAVAIIVWTVLRNL